MSAATEPLFPVEQVGFHTLIDLLGGRYTNARPALMRAALDGRPVAVVVAVQETDGATVRVDPVAVLIDDALFAQLDPGDDVGIGGGCRPGCESEEPGGSCDCDEPGRGDSL